MANTKKETLQMQSDRSATIRANIKRYYIYVVLALIVFRFQRDETGSSQVFRTRALPQPG